MLWRSVEEKKCQGAFLLQANWAAAALWRLCHAPNNAARALYCAAKTLLRLLPSGEAELDSLRKAALGCVSLMMHQEELQPPLVQMAAPYLLRQLAAAPTRPSDQRLTASRTLDGTIGSVGPLLPPLMPALPEPAIPLAPPPATEEEAAAPAQAPAAAPAPATALALPVSGEMSLELLMLGLLDDPDAELRALGCRGLARAAMRGAQKSIVDAGGAKLLMAHTLGNEVRDLPRPS